MSPPPPPPPPPIEEPSMDAAPGGQALASAGLRVAARFLDSMIVGLVFGFIFAAFVLSGDDDGGGIGGFGADASFAKLYLLAILNVAAYFVWDAVATKMLGGTPMKLAFGMRVVQQDGSDVEWEHAIKRWMLPGALGLIPPVVGLSLITGLAQFVLVIVSLVFIFSKPLRTAVWDLFAGTLVISTR